MAANGCIGLCCACFNIKGLQPLDFAVKDPATVHITLDMLRPLPAKDADTGWQLYTCRHWDRQTKLCRIYEQRPQMCRAYPEAECGWEGCSFKRDLDDVSSIGYNDTESSSQLDGTPDEPPEPPEYGNI